MEINLNVHFDDRFSTALECLAAALNCNTFDYTKAAQAVVVAKQETAPEQPVPAPTPAAQPVGQLAATIPAPVVQQPTVTVAPPATPPPAAVPTAPQTYTMEQLAVAATQLVDAGRREELVGLLGQFGVQALTALPKERYGAFATALRQMGAKI